MDKKAYKEYLDIALKASNEAAGYLLTNFGKTKEYTHKSKYHIGIDEDKKANDIYEKRLRKLTPDINIYSEEGNKNLRKGLSWIVDPIEGTSNYMVGNHYWATQICLTNGNESLVSVVRIPCLKQVFYATCGGGAYLNGEKINTSSVDRLDMALICTDKGHSRNDMLWLGKVLNKLVKKVRTYRHFGSCGIELCYTAMGMVDAFINKGSYLYDFAPGELIVREAGGKTSSFLGKLWGLRDREILASNGKIHGQLLEILIS